MSELRALGAVTTGQPREVSFASRPCRCVKTHVPRVNHTVIHHIVPQGWGGPDIVANTVAICPTTHSEVHRMLDAFTRAGAALPKRREWGGYAYALACRAWSERP